MAVLRLVSWNVRSLRDGAAGVAGVLRELRPDLVVLQEAPRLAGWRVSRHRLARRAGLRVLPGGKAAGNVLLARPGMPVREPGSQLLPRRPRLHRRALVTAQVLLDGRPLVVSGTHLDLDAAARLDSAALVRGALPDLPAVVCADVNDVPGSPAWQLLSRGLQDAGAGCGPTFSVASPRRRIDALLVDPALQVMTCRVVPVGPVSDHFPLYAELSWR